MTERMGSALAHAARRVALLRNCNSLVGKLPADILFLIFETCSTVGSPREHLRTTLSISHTCSYWRSLSLVRPSLWNSMDLSTIPERLAWLLCERSGSSPMYTSWPISIYSTTRREFASTFCTQNLWRMAHLSLVATRKQLVPWVYEGGAPQLRRVFLQDADAFAGSPLILERPLFQGFTPQLRHLSLVGIRFPWAAGMYRNLTTLEVVRCNVGPESAEDIDLCHVFRDSPSLEVLSLSLRAHLHWDVAQDTLLATPTSISSNQGRIPLLSLRILKLELPVPYAVRILQMIMLPAELEELSLCLDSPHSHTPHLLTILQPSLIPSEIFSPTERFQICDRASRGGIQICGYGTGSAADSVPRWEYSWKHRSRLPRSLLSDIAHTLPARYPLHLVRTVELIAEDGNCLDTGDAFPLLSQLSSMAAFHSLTWSSAVLCRMFATCSADGGCSWPSLQELRIVLCAFTPTMREVLDAIVGLCQHTKKMRFVNITYRMGPFLEAEGRMARDAVQRIHDMGIVVCCRREAPCPTPDSLGPVEEFVPTDE